MFDSLFKHAQASVDNALEQAIYRVLIAVPFLVAIGFATSALYISLDRAYGAETAGLILSALYMAAGLLAYAFFGRSSPPDEVITPETKIETEAEPVAEAGTIESLGLFQGMSQADKDLALAALTSAAPSIVRGVMRNLPLVAIILAILVITLSTSRGANEEPVSSPGS